MDTSAAVNPAIENSYVASFGNNAGNIAVKTPGTATEAAPAAIPAWAVAPAETAGSNPTTIANKNMGDVPDRAAARLAQANGAAPTEVVPKPVEQPFTPTPAEREQTRASSEEPVIAANENPIPSPEVASGPETTNQSSVDAFMTALAERAKETKDELMREWDEILLEKKTAQERENAFFQKLLSNSPTGTKKDPFSGDEQLSSESAA